jgi:hypothetical protein
MPGRQRLALRTLAELDDQIAKAQTARQAPSTRCAAYTTTSSDASTSPASSPPAWPPNRSTKPTRTSHCTPSPTRE